MANGIFMQWQTELICSTKSLSCAMSIVVHLWLFYLAGMWHWCWHGSLRNCPVGSVHHTDQESRLWKCTIIYCLWKTNCLWKQVITRHCHWSDCLLLCFWYLLPRRSTKCFSFFEHVFCMKFSQPFPVCTQKLVTSLIKKGCCLIVVRVRQRLRAQFHLSLMSLMNYCLIFSTLSRWTRLGINIQT